MMMTEVAGMGSEMATSPGTTKGKAAFNLIRQRTSTSEDAVMTTFMNNNNNNNLEVDSQSRGISSPFPNNNRSQPLEKGGGGGSDDVGNEEQPMVLQVEELEIDKKKSNLVRHEEGETRISLGENSPRREGTGLKNEDSQNDMIQGRQAGLSHNEQGGDEEEGMMILDEDGFSDDGEMPEEVDDDSDKDEHRITVREALMSRAYQAAAAKYGHGGNKYSTQSGRPSSTTGGQRSPSSSSPSGMNGHSRSHGHHHHHKDHHHRDHTSHPHLHQSRHSYTSSSSHHQIQRHSYLTTETDNFIKAERRSHPSSPVTCDLKPESLVANDGGSVNGLGNALLSLASLGGLAALQQSIPNFMANVGHGHNAPLNLTHPNARDLSSHLSQLQSRNSPSTLNNGNGNSNPNPNASMSPNSLIANAIASITGGSGGGLHQQQGSIPQLILASGHISQGIQGAQLLIPTSQGIMSQTVLTIPITQPGSPPSALSPSTASQVHHHHPSSVPLPPNPGGQHGSKRQQHHHHHHQMPTGGLPLGPHRSLNHPQSPSIASAAPQRNRESASSPDFPHDHARTFMGLGPHLVGQGQQLGGHMPTIQEKLALDHHSVGLNGIRNIHGKRERESGGSGVASLNLGGNCGSTLCPPKSSPCSVGDSIHDHDSDKFSDTEDDQMVDGINLDEIKEFAKAFKLRRLSLGLTQTQVGQALSITEGPAYSQSAICSALAWQLAQSQSYPPSIHQQSMFEKLDITPKSAQKIKPVLERWMREAEERYKNGHQNLNEFVGMEPSKKRKRRTSFTPQALEILNNHFERNTHPSGAEITTLAHQLGYEREVIRIWFCNKRQALKNTVRMMSKSSSPM